MRCLIVIKYIDAATLFTVIMADNNQKEILAKESSIDCHLLLIVSRQQCGTYNFGTMAASSTTIPRIIIVRPDQQEASGTISTGIAASSADASQELGGCHHSSHVAKQFPWRLHEMLDTAEALGLDEVVSWLPDGRSFKVHDPKRFEWCLMKRCFNQTKYKSFQRQLNLWGFQRNSNVDPVYSIKGTCSHPMFLRNRRDLCSSISRLGPNRGRVDAEPSIDTDSDTASIAKDLKQRTTPKRKGKVSPQSKVAPPGPGGNSTGVDVALLTKRAEDNAAASHVAEAGTATTATATGTTTETQPEPAGSGYGFGRPLLMAGENPNLHRMMSNLCAQRAVSRGGWDFPTVSSPFSRQTSDRSIAQSLLESKYGGRPNNAALSSLLSSWRAQQAQTSLNPIGHGHADPSPVIAALRRAEAIHLGFSGTPPESSACFKEERGEEGKDGADVVGSSPRSVVLGASPTSAFSDVNHHPSSHHHSDRPKRTMAVGSGAPAASPSLLGAEDRAVKRAKRTPPLESSASDQASQSQQLRGVDAITAARHISLLATDQAMLQQDYLRGAVIMEQLRLEAAMTLLQQQELEAARQLLVQEMNSSTGSSGMHLIASAAAAAAAGKASSTGQNGDSSTSANAATAGNNDGPSSGTSRGAAIEYASLLRRAALASWS
jgi:HSF-type DNA-binding